MCGEKLLFKYNCFLYGLRNVWSTTVTKKEEKQLINNFLMSAVGLNPYFLLLFSRYADLEIGFQSKKKKEHIRKYRISQRGGLS